MVYQYPQDFFTAWRFKPLDLDQILDLSHSLFNTPFEIMGWHDFCDPPKKPEVLTMRFRCHTFRLGDRRCHWYRRTRRGRRLWPLQVEMGYAMHICYAMHATYVLHMVYLRCVLSMLYIYIQYIYCISIYVVWGTLGVCILQMLVRWLCTVGGAFRLRSWENLWRWPKSFPSNVLDYVG